MANSTRDIARRKLQSANDILSNSIDHLQWFVDTYVDSNPHYTEGALIVIDMIGQLKKFINEIRESI